MDTFTPPQSEAEPPAPWRPLVGYGLYGLAGFNALTGLCMGLVLVLPCCPAALLP